MAKKQDKAQGPAKALTQAAWDALSAGDALTARRLASAVLGGKAGEDEAGAAKKVGKLLAAEGEKALEEPAEVARAVLQRTRAPPKAFLLGGVAALIYLLLLVLATVRY